MKRWVSKRCNADFSKIASHYNITEIFAEILVKRGLYTWEAMDKYLFPDIGMMYPPELMKGLKKAGQLLSDSIKQGKKIGLLAIMMLMA